MSDDKIHAMHSPSSSNIWLDCSLHYHYKKEALGKGAVWDSGGEAAKRGTIQHTVAEKAMNSIQNGLDVETAVDRAIRTLRFKLTEEERENVTLSMHMVLDLTTDTMDVQTEVSVDLSYEPGSTGTVDLLGDWDGQHYMLVADYKYGQTPVSPNSSQLKIYGASAINRDELDPDFEVKLAVIQPKLHSEALVRSYTVQELVEFGHYVDGVVDAQVNGHDRRGAGSLKTCEWCPAKKYCYHRPTLVRSMLSDLTMDSEIPNHVVEHIVLSRSAMKKVIDECTAKVAGDPKTFPNWRRAEVANGPKWSPLFDSSVIEQKLVKSGAGNVYNLATPLQVKDRNQESKKVQSLVDKLSIDQGHHIRLYPGAPNGAPKEEPAKRPGASVPEAKKKKASKKKSAPKKAAKKKARKRK